VTKRRQFGCKEECFTSVSKQIDNVSNLEYRVHVGRVVVIPKKCAGIDFAYAITIQILPWF